MRWDALVALACILVIAEATQNNLTTYRLQSVVAGRKLLMEGTQGEYASTRSIDNSQQLIQRAVSFRGQRVATRKAVRGAQANAQEIVKNKFKPDFKDGNRPATLNDDPASDSGGDK